MNIKETETWKTELLEFKEKTAEFYAGNLTKGEYKGISGKYGSYAQRGGKASMLRLRMPAGCVTKEKMQFLADTIRKYQVDCVHFTTCQTIQLHNLKPEEVCRIAEEALETGIVTIGGGGDYPRNVMCSPLSGVEQDEYFDVRPWAKAAGEYLLQFIHAKKMPRKLKVCFSNSPANLVHATYRDLGFTANEDGTFDVYSAGGLGNNARFGVKVASGIAPEMILYYIKAMWLTFISYGNYESRGKARTRYMPESLGGPGKYTEAYREKLEEVLKGEEDLRIYPKEMPVQKKGDDSRISGPRILKQKQEGLYTVIWHPMGGQPRPESLCALNQVMQKMEEVEMRLAPDETAYVINLTGDEAKEVLEAVKDSADTLFETSVSCIGASICQVGLRDSQELLRACVDAVQKAKIPDGALPQMHISGCPSSCGTHQTGMIGFRGASKSVEGKSKAAFVLYVQGEEYQGKEAFGQELGTIEADRIPDFLVKLGKTVAKSGLDFKAWNQQNPQGIKEAAADYL